MARATNLDPLKLYRFAVDISGFSTTLGFSEVTGLSWSTALGVVKEGGNNQDQKYAEQSSFPDITLRRGQFRAEVPGARDMQDWVDEVHAVTVLGLADKDYRRSATIYQYGRAGDIAASWDISICFPTRFVPVGPMNGLSSENSIVELVLAHEGYIQTK